MKCIKRGRNEKEREKIRKREREKKLREGERSPSSVRLSLTDKCQEMETRERVQWVSNFYTLFLVFFLSLFLPFSLSRIQEGEKENSGKRERNWERKK